MTTVLVTGAGGFVGRNLVVRLREHPAMRVLPITRAHDAAALRAAAAAADAVVHLAGVNRPERVEEFHAGNVGGTARLLDVLAQAGRQPHVLVASSIQATLDNPYGRSKREAEALIEQWVRETGASATVFRLKNLFGKWCRPHYNSVVATFCHDLAYGEPIVVRDPACAIDLCYIDDVVDALLSALAHPAPPGMTRFGEEIPGTRITLGALAERLRGFASRAESLLVPELTDRFTRQLYATYVSYLAPEAWAYHLPRREDPRGDLAEFIKGPAFGQVFVSRTRPGVTRGNHYHHTKVEKFLVVAGTGMIRFRHVEGGELLEFLVRGEEYRVVEIPPGYTHSITNVGDIEMITLFWASEVFDPERPDTMALPVLPAAGPTRA